VVHVDPPKVKLFERLKFLHALENDQGFLPHTRLGMGVPPTIFNDEHSKIGLKFGVCTPITLGLCGATSPNFSTWRAARQAWSRGYNFGGTAPLEFGRVKTVPKLVRFCATSHFDHDYLQNGWTYRQAEKYL